MTDAATPNADQTPPEQPTANRTAGDSLDAGIGLTQAQLDAIIQTRLADQERRWRDKYGDPEELVKAKAELDKLREAELSEVDKLKKAFDDKVAELAAAEEKAEEARLNALRLRVGQELGLNPILSALLQGADEEAIRTHAQQILAAMPEAPSGVTIPNLNASAGGGQPIRRGVKLTPEQEAAILNAQKADPTFTRERYIAALEQFKEKD